MKSIWSKTAELPQFEAQSGDINTEVLVIGGGIAGILCAYMLQRAGIDCVLVEANTICSGTTANTTAKITAQHGLIYDKLLRRFGKQRTRMYLAANLEAVENYRILCNDIDCDFENKDSFVYSRKNGTALEKELLALGKIGYSADFEPTPHLPFSTAGAVVFREQAQMNPLKFAAALCKGLTIFEHTRVLALDGTTAVTDNGKITAEKIITATHFPFINKHGSYFLKQYQHRSYVLALENAQPAGGMFIGDTRDSISLRDYNGLLLVGGGAHRTGKSIENRERLMEFKERFYPKASIVCKWSAQDCMSLDSVPYIGNYSALTPDLYVASGFNKWGMTSSMVAATLLTDLLCGRENPYCAAFSPSRTIMRGQLVANAYEAATSLLTPSKKRCPHLGCALKWNRYEHSWDCSCHGSRFADNGQVLDNPSNGDLKQ